jgi:hypothetical protein
MSGIPRPDNNNNLLAAKGKVMPNKSKAPKWTAKQIKEHIKNIEKAIEKHRKKNKEKYFEAITPEEIEEKLNRVNSPFIKSVGYGDAPHGGTLNLNIGIYNPDPITFRSLYVHTFVGSGNIDPNLGTFLLNVDTRFARLTAPPTHSGQTLASEDYTILSFSLDIPPTVEKTVYLLNACLFERGIFSTGTFFDRASLSVVVS